MQTIGSLRPSSHDSPAPCKRLAQFLESSAPRKRHTRRIQPDPDYGGLSSEDKLYNVYYEVIRLPFSWDLYEGYNKDDKECFWGVIRHVCGKITTTALLRAATKSEPN